MTDEQKQFVSDNHNLIYSFLKKHGLDVEENYDLAAIGLCKAVITYNNTKSSFSNYAYKCMFNEVFYEQRKKLYKSKIPENIIYSYNREIDGEDDEIDLLYFIADKTDVANDAISKIFYENRLSKLTDRDQLIIQMTVNGYSQKEISKKIGISQSQVSRIIRGIVKKYFK